MWWWVLRLKLPKECLVNVDLLCGSSAQYSAVSRRGSDANYSGPLLVAGTETAQATATPAGFVNNTGTIASFTFSAHLRACLCRP